MTPIFALAMPGFQELLIILVILLVLFGAKRLPELARGLGQSLHEFRRAKSEFEKETRRPDSSFEKRERPDPPDAETA